MIGASLPTEDVAWGNNFQVFVTDTDVDPSGVPTEGACDGGNLQSRLPADEPAYHEIECNLSGRYIYFLKPAAEPMLFKGISYDTNPFGLVCTGTEFFMPGPLSMKLGRVDYAEISLNIPNIYGSSCDITYSLAPSSETRYGPVSPLVRLEDGTKLIAEINPIDYSNPLIYDNQDGFEFGYHLFELV